MAEKPVALAGVMGGQATEIDGNSQTVVLEAAVLMANRFVKPVVV